MYAATVSEFICAPILLYQEDTLALTISPLPLNNSPSPEGGVGWRRPIQDSVFKGLLLFAHCPVVGLCVSSHMLEEEVSLIMVVLCIYGWW